MLMDLDQFLNRIRKGLEGRGHSKGSIDFHIARLTEVYEKSPIFGELEIDETYDDIEEFEDGIKDVPLSIDRLMNDDSIPFKIMEKTNDEQVERRIHQLKEHYQNVQSERGEVLFPPEEAAAIDLLNERGMFGRTPLIQAACDDDLKEVERLLDLGANPALKDSSGNDALQIAIINDYRRVANRLKKEFVRSSFDLFV